MSLRRYPDYLTGFDGHEYQTTTAVSSISNRWRAVQMALKVNDIPVPSVFAIDVIKEVARRERSKPRHERSNATYDQICSIVKKWGDESERLTRMMIAMAMGIGFIALLRYSDLCYIHLRGMYWFQEGVAICLAKRKTDQAAKSSWVYVADTNMAKNKRTRSLVQRLRTMVKRRFGTAPPEVGVMDVDAYLFCDMVASSGSKHYSKRVDRFNDKGIPMGKAAYGHYLTRMREAFVVCCGVKREDVKEYGTHSLRIGGDTWLFDNGIPAVQRREMGAWLTPVTEYSYLRHSVLRSFDFVRKCGL
jgi:hypothetical protein